MKFFEKKVKTEEKQIPLLIWKENKHGGISDEYNETDDSDITEWIILTTKVRFKVDGQGALPLPLVDQPPEKLARLMGCMPRQKLNASDKDWLQRLRPYAPVVVIAIGLLYLFIMGSA